MAVSVLMIRFCEMEIEMEQQLTRCSKRTQEAYFTFNILQISSFVWKWTNNENVWNGLLQTFPILGGVSAVFLFLF